MFREFLLASGASLDPPPPDQRQGRPSSLGGGLPPPPHADDESDEDEEDEEGARRLTPAAAKPVEPPVLSRDLTADVKDAMGGNNNREAQLQALLTDLRRLRARAGETGTFSSPQELRSFLLRRQREQGGGGIEQTDRQAWAGLFSFLHMAPLPAAAPSQAAGGGVLGGQVVAGFGSWLGQGERGLGSAVVGKFQRAVGDVVAQLALKQALPPLHTEAQVSGSTTLRAYATALPACLLSLRSLAHCLPACLPGALPCGCCCFRCCRGCRRRGRGPVVRTRWWRGWAPTPPPWHGE